MLHDVLHLGIDGGIQPWSPDLRPRVPGYARSLQGHMHAAGKLRSLQPRTRQRQAHDLQYTSPCQRRTVQGGLTGALAAAVQVVARDALLALARLVGPALLAGPRAPVHVQSWLVNRSMTTGTRELRWLHSSIVKHVLSRHMKPVLACKSWAAPSVTARKWEHEGQHRSAHPCVHTTGSSSPEGKGPRHWDPVSVLLVPSPAAPLVWNSKLHWSARG